MKSKMIVLTLLLLTYKAQAATNTFPTTGNAGVGTTTPNAKLDVTGGYLRALDNGTNVTPTSGKGLEMLGFSSASYVQSYNRDASVFQPIYFGASNFYFNGGNVGMGTTSPGAALEVNNVIKLTNGSADPNDGKIGAAPFLAGLNIVGINTDGGGRKINEWGSILQNENPVGNVFAGQSSFSGNVGIGTASPAAKLDISQSWTSPYTSFLRLTNSSPVGQTPLDFYINGTLRAKARADYVGNLNLIANGGSFYFLTGGEGGTTQMIIYNTGLVSVAGTISANLFSGNGSALSSLNASNLTAGQVPVARLGTGTPTTSTYLCGNGSWQPVTATVTPAGTTGQLQYNNGGALGAVPFGTTTQVYHGNPVGVGSFSAVNLLTDVTGTLPIAQGGTGQTTKASAFNALSPLSAKGDLLTYDGTALTNTQLPRGGDGQVLTVDSNLSTGLKWATPAQVPTINITTANGLAGNGVAGAGVNGTGTIGIANGGIVDSMISSTAAIAGTKINPAFGTATVSSQAIVAASNAAQSISLGSTPPSNGLLSIGGTTAGYNVAIKDSNPSILLTDTGTGNTAGFLRVKDADGLTNRAEICSYSHTGTTPDGLVLRNYKSGPIAFFTNAAEAARFDATGNFGIGTAAPSAKLHVLGNSIFEGTLSAQEVHVTANGFPDYVFEPNYKLLSLKEVESAIKAEGHLPGVPSAKEIAKKGLAVSEMANIQMQKIEEMTLYMIKMQRQQDEMLKSQAEMSELCKTLVSENKALKQQLESLKQR